MLCFCPYAILDIKAILEKDKLFGLRSGPVFLLYDTERTKFLILSSDALMRILEIQSDLSHSMTSSTRISEMDASLTQQWLVRDLIMKVN